MLAGGLSSLLGRRGTVLPPTPVAVILHLITFLLIPPAPVTANYREFGFLNHDLCISGDKGRSLKLGKSAALLTLDSTDHSYPHKCSIKLQADKGFGLMAYIEDMELNGAIGLLCKEYVQFGRDDILPFITIDKSEKLCGNRTGFFYEEPDGKLLIWLKFSSRKLPADRPKKLSIVITPYIPARLASETTDYRLCQSGDRAIKKVYFCDDRVNCALDRHVPGDERPDICRHVPGRNGAGNSGVDADQPAMWSPPLNLVSITLVLVSGVVVLVIVLLLISRLRRFGLCCYKNRRGSCELPEGILGGSGAGGNSRSTGGSGGVTATSRNLHRGTGGGEAAVGMITWENHYVPLTHLSNEGFSGTSGGGGGGGARPRPTSGGGGGRGTTPIDSEPPPAYHDLFPPGYKYDPGNKLETTIETSLIDDSSLSTVGVGAGGAVKALDTATTDEDDGEESDLVPPTAVATPQATANNSSNNTADNLQQLGAVVGGTEDAGRRAGLPAAADTATAARRDVPAADATAARSDGGGGDSQNVVDQVNKAT